MLASLRPINRRRLARLAISNPISIITVQQKFDYKYVVLLLKHQTSARSDCLVSLEFKKTNIFGFLSRLPV